MYVYNLHKLKKRPNPLPSYVQQVAKISTMSL